MSASTDSGKSDETGPITDIGAEDAKRSFGELLGRVRYGNERFMITRHGKPVALLVGIDRQSDLAPTG